MKKYKDKKDHESPGKDKVDEKQHYEIHDKKGKKTPQRIWPTDQEKHKGPKI